MQCGGHDMDGRQLLARRELYYFSQENGYYRNFMSQSGV